MNTYRNGNLVQNKAIAVVGISFDLPGCSSWEDLAAVFEGKIDHVSTIPVEREGKTCASRPHDARHGCWLESPTGFNYSHFGLARGEAELIDPRQRMMLQLASDAISNGGYSPAELRGRNVAVITANYGSASPSLVDLLTDEAKGSGLASIGSLSACSAGRIAYHLDLRGPAMVIDTACSSFFGRVARSLFETYLKAK